MKIRTGFVSNSSTSSFCIYGAWLGEDDIKKIARHFDKETSDEEFDDFENYDYEEILCSEFYITTPEYCDTAIGQSIHSMKDSETKEEFKMRVQKQLSDALGEEVKCDWIEHSYYN